MEKEGVKRGVAVTVTSLVLIILVLAGPANAVVVTLDIQDPNVEKGSLINFEATTEIESGEVLQVDYFILKLVGPETIECRFDVNGSVIGGCDGINITHISSAPYHGYGYSYGYGYGEGFFRFNITLDTSYYFAGKYETYLEVMGDVPSQKRGKDIHVRPKTGFDDLAGCSVRADGGNLEAEGELFGKGKINFHIPLGNANNGKGSLTAQKGRERYSYKFNVVEIIYNDDDLAIIKVAGECKINGGPKQPRTAEIHYNKIFDTIDVYCTKLNIHDMEISFKKWC
jgi:hypothetical protein